MVIDRPLTGSEKIYRTHSDKLFREKHKKKGLLYIGSDMNAKILDPGDYHEDGIGSHILEARQTKREEGKGVEDNRTIL